MMKGGVLDMITIEKPDKPYVVLESVNGKEDNKKERNLHMIFSNEGHSLKVGRGHQCEMRINDISVSRTHAEMCFHNNKFYIKDMKSKFGTIVKFK
jgi:pSer/pThr/pTyr-binding forkhead associated (FHA) protein